MEKEKRISTPAIQEANDVVVILQNNLSKILNQNLWKKKIGISEKIEYLKQIAYARKNLWQAVSAEYPETIGKNISVNSVEITF